MDPKDAPAEAPIESVNLHEEGDNMFTKALEDFMEKEGDNLDFGQGTGETFEVEDEDAPPAKEAPVAKEGDDTPPVEDKVDDLKAELEGEIKAEPVKKEADTDFETNLKAEIAELYNDPKPGIKFAALKREAKEYKAEIERLRTETPETDEVVQLRAQAAASSTVQAELDEAKQRLNLIDYESTPEYEQQIVQPFRDLEVAAKYIDEANGLDEGTTLAAISHRDRAAQDNMVTGIVDQLSVRDQTRVYALADSYLTLNQKASVAREQAGDRLGAYEEQSTTAQAAESERGRIEYQRDVNGVFDKYEGRLPGFVSDGGDITESYATAKAAAAGVDFGSMSGGEKAYASFSAHILPEALSQLQGMQSQIVQLKQLNAELSAAKPNLNSGKAPAPAAKSTPKSLYELNDDDVDDIRFG